MPPPIILTIGSLNTDLTSTVPRHPNAGETLHSTSFTTAPGGKGLNQAVAAARLSSRKLHTSASTPASSTDTATPSTTNPTSIENAPSAPKPTAKVRMIGAVGNNSFGPFLKNVLEENGVAAEGVKTVAGESGVAVIIVEERTGENRILVNAGANAALLPSDFPDDFFSAGGEGDGVELVVMQLETPVETVVRVLELASRTGSTAAGGRKKVKTLFNPAPAREDLPADIWSKVDYLIVNETEAAIMSGIPPEALDTGEGVVRAASRFVEKGVKEAVVVTLGARGCYYCGVKKVGKKERGKEREEGKDFQGKDLEGKEPAEGFLGVGDEVRKEDVKDTTGAGDTFVGAFAVAAVEGRGLRESAAFAGSAAGRAVMKRGAVGGIPWRDELEG